MNERLRESRERVWKLERTTRRRNELREECARLAARERDLAQRLARERKAVDRLQEFSLQAIWHSLRGDKPEALAEEKREYLYFEVKHDEAAARLAETKTQLDTIESDMAALHDAKEGHARELASEERPLRNGTGPDAERLRAIASQEAGWQDDLRQLKEAESAALDATSALSTVDEHLGAARNWGGVDIIGGGIVTTAIKHSQINSARSSLARAQVKLRALERELGDVGRVETFSIDIGRFATFADYFCDGFVVDLFVQSRIHDARERIVRTIADVRRIESDLRGHERRARAALLKLGEERRRIVEGDEAQGDAE
jgi:hypothetical protein